MFILNTVTKAIAQVGDAESLNIPPPDTASSVQNILNTLFIIVGAVSVIFIIIGGFRYVVSAGDPENTAKAKNTILYAVIGLAVSILATGIVSFVLGRI